MHGSTSKSGLSRLQLAGCPPTLAHLDQYAGPWAIEPRQARLLIGTVNNLNLAVHVDQHQTQAELRAAAMNSPAVATYQGDSPGKIALVRLEGVMTKYGSSLSDLGSTVGARRQIRAAKGDKSITGILLILDTPGGTVSGTVDLVEDVREAAAVKPVYAYCEDLCASAGYWVASQATKVFANSNAVVGSIGVFAVLEDWSKAFDKEGVKVHVVRFGEMKGAGVRGTEVTEPMLEEGQKLIDVIGRMFVNSIQSGRRLSKSAAEKLADGRVYVGEQAVPAKLIDGVQSIDQTREDLLKAKASTATDADPPRAKRYFPAAAAASYSPAPVQRNEPMPAQLTDAQIVQEWDRRVQAQLDAGKPKREAVRSVAVSDPAFQREYLRASTAESHKRRGR